MTRFELEVKESVLLQKKFNSLLKKPHLRRCMLRLLVRRSLSYVSAGHQRAPSIWGFLSRLQVFQQTVNDLKIKMSNFKN